MFRPGRDVRSCSTSTAMAIILPASSAAFAASSPTAPGSSHCPIAAMRVQPGNRASTVVAGRSCRLCLHGRTLSRGQHRRLGLFARHRRSGGDGCGAADREADPGSSLYVDRRCRRVDVLVCAGASVDTRSVPFRRADRAGQGSIARDTRRARSAIPVAFGERLFALANEPKRFVRLARGSHNDLDNFGGIEIARNFIDLAKG